MDDEPLDLRIHNRGRGSSISLCTSTSTSSSTPVNLTTFSNQVRVICRASAIVRTPTAILPMIPPTSTTRKLINYSPPSSIFSHTHHQRNTHSHNHHHDHQDRSSTMYSVPSSSTSSRSSADEDMELDHDAADDEGSLVIVETLPSAPQEELDVDVEEEEDEEEVQNSGIPSGNSVNEEDSSVGSSFVIQISMTQDGGVVGEEQEQESRNSVINNRTGRSTSKHLPAMERLLKSSRLLCFLCDQKAKNGKTLETHIAKCHSITTTHGKFLCCTLCGFKCTLITQLKEHFTEKHSEAMKGGIDCKKAYYPCSHCSRMYRKQSLLDAHMRLVNQKDNWKKIIST